MKSLSELQSSPDVGLPETHADICVAARIVDELTTIDAELFETLTKVERFREAEAAAANGDSPAPPTRSGHVSPLPGLEEKAADLAAKADAVRARIEENNVRVLLRGRPAGEWRLWATAHPARDAEKDPQGAERDEKWAGGHVNIDALAADLPAFVGRYNDEEPSEAWAAFIASKGAPHHLVLAASKVVGLHESVVDAGKSRSDWLATRRSVTVSD